ncbi:SCO7613 C-terminal domain-containing membrane protein [Ornithinimicrobium sediminis]|uniref:SCO7613 C-terminal domain-containing membrane protein n=1 Tax=Ornithinimicrobium sediminis TaxID=2904603 RepID=UPI001E56B3EE|nr:hypothetical protein [Ornithinimicrobium sediminis]MCE0486927.1 hypothetical protein [Ornithinimicrobium sediminis]
MPGTAVCPSCGLRLEGALGAELFATLTRADRLLEQMATAAASPTGALPAPATAAPGPPAEPVAPGAPAAPAAPGPAGTAAAPAAPAPARRGLSTASVPTILLGLGALCLLVAALVFLAVTWSAMGVGGRTVTLVGFTLAAGALTAWTARRGLRAAVESLGVVTLGLLAFDLVGARDAGWLGDIGTPGLLLVLGLVLLAAGAGATLVLRRSPVGAFVGGQVVAVVGLATAAAGTLASEGLSWSVGATVAVVGTWLVARAAFAATLRVLAVGAVAAGAVLWLLLAVSSLARALDHPSLRELWLDLEVWPLLVSAALLLTLGLVRGLPEVLRRSAFALAGVVLAAVVLVPTSDEPATLATLAGAGLLVVLSGLVGVLPPRARPGVAAPVVLLTLWMLLVVLDLSADATARLMTAGDTVWGGSVGTVLDPPAPVSDLEPAAWTLPLVVVATVAGLVALARSARWAHEVLRPLAHPDVLVAVAAATVVLGLTAYTVPLWLPLLLLLLTGGVLAGRAVLTGSSVPLLLAVAALALGLLVSLHSEGLTLVAVAVSLPAALAVHLRGPAGVGAAGAGAALAVLAAALVWTGGALLDVSQQWTALAALLVLAGLVLLMPYVGAPVRAAGPAWTGVGLEAGVLFAAAAVSLAAVTEAGSADEATWAAVYLTVTGATASAVALTRADRRPVGWLGGVLLAAASWVRLADVGVDTVEAYSLPAALALVVVGVAHLRRHADTGTLRALSPGLLLALVPSLVWALDDPVSLRSLLLGTACLGLLAAGLRLHWAAPVVHAAVVGALLVLRLATPVAEAVPRWALIGMAGAVLIGVGITWEQRLKEARAVAGYVRRLR